MEARASLAPAMEWLSRGSRDCLQTSSRAPLFRVQDEIDSYRAQRRALYTDMLWSSDSEERLWAREESRLVDERISMLLLSVEATLPPNVYLIGRTEDDLWAHYEMMARIRSGAVTARTLEQERAELESLQRALQSLTGAPLPWAVRGRGVMRRGN